MDNYLVNLELKHGKKSPIKGAWERDGASCGDFSGELYPCPFGGAFFGGF